ncbi:MAG: hypothetical protein MJ053_03810 [Elusimicrobiaceae bacterium]|nr:hypothetical protein [Elusimicrobiaceae bacterium]
MFQPDLVFRAAQAADGRSLARVLRKNDRRELACSHAGQEIADCLERFICESYQSVCLIYRGEVAALAGICVQTMLSPSACVWLLTGRNIERCPFSFVRLAKRQLRRWLDLYPVLENEFDSRYCAAGKLIVRLGGEITGRKTQHHGICFLHFVFRRSKWEEL